MKDTIISIRLDERLRERMRMQEHINWSALIRNILSQQIENFERANTEKMQKASKSIDKIRKTGIFNKGKTGAEIIKEWRNKHRF